MGSKLKGDGVEFPDGITQTKAVNTVNNVPPTDGNIEIQGYDPNSDSPNGSLSTGFQSNSLTNYYSTVGEFPGTVNTICNLGDGIVLVGTSRTRSQADSESYGLIYRSIDYGQSWIQVFDGTLIDNTDNFDTYSEECAVIENCGKGRVLAGFGGSYGDAQILKSDDFGQTWQFSPDFSLNKSSDEGSAASAFPDSYYSIKSIKYLGDGWVILGTGYNEELYFTPTGDATIWYSSDYGNTWVKNTNFSTLNPSVNSIDSIEYFYEIPTNTHRIVLGVRHNFSGIQILHSSETGSDRLLTNTNFSSFTNDFISGSEVNVIKNIGGTVGLFGTNTSLYKFDLKDTQSGPTWINVGVSHDGVNDIEYCGQGRVVLALTNPLSGQPGILIQSNDYGETFEQSSVQNTIHGESSFKSLRYLGQNRILAGSDLDGTYPEETGYVYVGTPPTPKGRTFYPINKPLTLNLLSNNNSSFSTHYSNGWHWITGLPTAPPGSIYVARILNEGAENQNLRTYIARPFHIITVYGDNLEPTPQIDPILETDADYGASSTQKHKGQWQGMLIPQFDPTDSTIDFEVDSWSKGIFIRSWGCTDSRLVLLGYYA